MRFVLASASPRRRELLLAAGLAFEVDPAHVDETRRRDEPAADYACRLAREKARVVAARHPGRVAVGADTVVVAGTDVLGKPADAADAERMLRLLSATTHEVLTAVAVASSDGRVEADVERTTVWFSPLSDEDIGWYVGTGEPLDKAGAYAIQGLASRFIPRIEGSYTNVVGLPVTLVVRLLAAFGIQQR